MTHGWAEPRASSQLALRLACLPQHKTHKTHLVLDIHKENRPPGTTVPRLAVGITHVGELGLSPELATCRMQTRTDKDPGRPHCWAWSSSGWAFRTDSSTRLLSRRYCRCRTCIATQCYSPTCDFFRLAVHDGSHLANIQAMTRLDDDCMLQRKDNASRKDGPTPRTVFAPAPKQSQATKAFALGKRPRACARESCRV